MLYDPDPIDWNALLERGVPDRCTLIDEVGTRWTRAEVVDALRRMGGGLVAAGLPRGARIGITMGSLEACFFATSALLCGRVPVLLDPSLPHAALAETCRRDGLAALFLTTADPGTPGTPALDDDAVLARFTTAPAADFATVPAGAEAAVLYTSGTTGRARGVRLPHRAIVASAHVLAARVRDPGELWALSAGFRTVTAFRLGLLFPLLLGTATLALSPNLPPLEMLAAATRAGAAVLNVGPGFVAACLRDPARAADAVRGGRLHTVMGAGAAVPAADRLAVARALRVRVAWNYGMTETAGTIATSWVSPDGTVDPGSGRPLVPVRIVAPDGTSVPVRELGEVDVAGPTTMLGYVGEPDVAVVRTHDLGRLDPDGTLHVHGRVERMHTQPSGEKVLLDELEAVCAERLGVPVHVDVVDLPRPVLVLLVELTAPEADWEAKVRSALATAVTAGAQPRVLATTTQLPRNAGGKVDAAAARRFFTG